MIVVIVIVIVVTGGKQSPPSLGFRLRLEFDKIAHGPPKG